VLVYGDVRVCEKCNKELPIDQFSLTKNGRYRKRSCDQCVSRRNAEYHQRLKKDDGYTARRRENKRNWYEKPEAKKAVYEYKKKWRQENSEKHNESNRRSYCNPGVKERKVEMERQRLKTPEGFCRKSLSSSKSQAKRNGIAPCNLTFEQLLDTVSNKCAICSGIPGEGEKRLCLDHDHYTGAFRGWLCWSCNTMLGMAQDSPDTLESAAKYLRDFYEK
jgi:hypothetical protein